MKYIQCFAGTIEDKDAAKKLAEASKAVKKLGQRKMGNAFVALRKIALHPLLARRIYTNDQIAEMAKLALRRYPLLITIF